MTFEQIPFIWLGFSFATFAAGLVCSFVFGGIDFALGFGAGGSLALANFCAASRKLKKTAFTHRGAVMASLVGGFYLRLLIIGLCLFGLIKFLKLNALGLIAGLSIVPAGLLVMLILIYVANRRPEEV